LVGGFGGARPGEIQNRERRKTKTQRNTQGSWQSAVGVARPRALIGSGGSDPRPRTHEGEER
jgi:hypothetical protein